MQLPRIYLMILAFAIIGYSACGDAEMKQENTQSAEQNKALIRQVLKLIDERNLDEAFELYALDYIYHGPGGRRSLGPVRPSRLDAANRCYPGAEGSAS